MLLPILKLRLHIACKLHWAGGEGARERRGVTARVETEKVAQAGTESEGS